MLIAGDIGGTKTLLALFDPERGARRPIAEAELQSADYDGLEAAVRAFLGRAQTRVEAACFDVAGPVVSGRARLTNLPWVVDAEALRSRLGLERVTLLNDLQAVAHAVPHLEPEDVRTLNVGTPEPHGAIAVIAPGTGLGEAFLVWSGSDYIACSSEGGHSSFGPGSEVEDELLRFLRGRHGHVGYEEVCSGLGLPGIFDFLREQGFAAEPSELAVKLAAAHDRTPVIVDAALRDPKGCALCVETLRLFVSVLGSEAGNLALKVMATGGVFVGGGIPPRILPQLEEGRFLQAFVDKGRFADLLGRIPVHVIVTRAALLGAAIRGLELMGSE